MGSKTITSLLLIASCLAIRHALMINDNEYENSILLTSLVGSMDADRQHIYLIPGTMYDLKSSSKINMSSFGLSDYKTRISSLDVDYSRKRLYIFDKHTAAIYVVQNFDWQQNFSSLSIQLLHNGLSRTFVHVSVDWISDNIYWTDPLFSWIVVQSLSRTGVYKILLKDALGMPFALAVDPVHRYLFWSEVGSTKKIERASLSGQDRLTIISSGLVSPTSIAVDQSANKLIWIDAARDTLETANMDGSERRIIRRESHSTFYDVAVFKDLIGAINLKNGTLVIINKHTGAVLNELRQSYSQPFVAIALYSPLLQPNKEDDCENTSCSDICVIEKHGPECLCREGYRLNPDGFTCSEDLGKYHRAFMWSNSSNICMMDIRSLTSNGHSDSIYCFFNGGSKIAHFDIDMNSRMVVFVDGTEIYSLDIGQNPVKQRLLAANEVISGIAVDWRDQIIYWCMGRTDGRIALVSQATLMEHTLTDTDLLYPNNLNVLPLDDILLWISGTFGDYKIEKSKLDGSSRKTVVSSHLLVTPKGLTVDLSTNTIYFIDAGYVKTCDTSGNQLSVLTPKTAFNSPMNVFTYKNYLVVADSSFPESVIKTYQKQSKPDFLFQLTTVSADEMTEMKVLDASLQPHQKGPCEVLNGDCEQICIPTGRNRTCRCEYGFKLDSNRKTCSSTLLSDNFLLITDWTHNTIYQISLVSDDIRAVDTDTYGSPLGVIYNHLTNQIVWSTEEIVHGINLNGTGYKVILNTEILGCHADRFAIDYSSGIIFYTANNVSTTGFTGVGILTPEGLHKRLIHSGVSPRAIVLDPEEGIMFWTDHGQSPACIKKANMDGSNIVTVKQADLLWPNGLAIDTQAKRLYVSDGGTNIIKRCSYQGVCTNYHTDQEAHLMDIHLHGSFLYYTAWNRPYVTKLHKTNPFVVSRVGYKPELGRLDSLSLYSSEFSSPSVLNTCSSNGGRGLCSTFCLPVRSGYTCGCEDGVNLLSDGKTCENAKTTAKSLTETATSLVYTPTSTNIIRTSTSTPITTSSTSITTKLPATTITTTMESSTAPKTTTALLKTSTDTTSGQHKHQPDQTTFTAVTTRHIKTTNLNFITTDSNETSLPVTAVVGIAVVFVLIVIVVVLAMVIVKSRQKRSKRRGTHNQRQSNTNIPFTRHGIQGPSSTYDLVRFDEQGEQSFCASNKNEHEMQTELNGENNVYDMLIPRAEFTPVPGHISSGTANHYLAISAVSETEISQPVGDYLTPVHRIQCT